MRYRLLCDGETGDVVRVVFEGNGGQVEWFGRGRIMFGSARGVTLETVSPLELSVGPGPWAVSEIREEPGLSPDDEDLPEKLLDLLE